MKFEAGKSYRLIDPEGFKSEEPMNETYYRVRPELSEAKSVKCIDTNDNGVLFEGELYIYHHERKYFEEI